MSENHCFTRQALYDLVWSEPMKTVAATIGISDVALAKACRRACIPVPERGYWAKKQAGRSANRPELPPRFPGSSDTVEVGTSKGWYRDTDLLNDPLPPPPEFSEDIVALRDRVSKMVGAVENLRLVTMAHPLIAKLLAQDEERRIEHDKYPYSWDKPRYESGIGKRRIRILNSVFVATHRLGCTPRMSTSKYAADNGDASIYVGNQVVHFNLKTINRTEKTGTSDKEKPRLALSILHEEGGTQAIHYWEDKDDSPIEKHLTSIVIEIMIASELQHRALTESHHKWRVQRKSELEEEARQKKIEAERKARELREKQERGRIERLLASATALQQAETIRSFVEAIRARSGELAASNEKIETWATWALAQANRIDPTKTLAFLKEIEEE